MLAFILGIIVGAAFAPFWIKCFEYVKQKLSPICSKVKSMFAAKK